MKLLRRLVYLLLASSLLLLSLPFILRFYWRLKEDNSIAKGARIARKLGCNQCHLPMGGKELPNPGSKFGTIPLLSGGSAMMYAKEENDLREYILYGYPKRKMGEKSYREYLKSPFHMPAFKGFINPSETSALLSYVKSISNWEAPQDEKLLLGLNTAVKWGCFNCHGSGGSGGVRNRGSFKGYIPGFLGGDFRELVRDDNEFRSWILEGKIKRLERNPIARYFIRRQALSMPAFKEVLSEGEVDALIQYVHYLRGDRPAVPAL